MMVVMVRGRVVMMMVVAVAVDRVVHRVIRAMIGGVGAVR